MLWELPMESFVRMDGRGIDEARRKLTLEFLRRLPYPDGLTYRCMGSDVGTCRANDELNQVKAEKLRRFVQTVEPGALYIHHEDVSLNEFEPLWKQREARCRKRWPNDSVTAPDGAAGGLAHLDSQLINAINTVKNPE